MDSIPLSISIIIPIYNVEKYILMCLQSVANQTLTEGIECILVDDCGTDNSMEIVERFISEHNGEIAFRVLYHKRNKGLSAARNTGILAAKGEYVYFLDSDDAITPNCMEGFHKIIEEHFGVDLIQGLISQNASYMNQFAEMRWPKYTDDRKYIKEALLDYNQLPVCAANKMVRRRLIIENEIFFKEGIIHEDNYWSFFLAKHVKSMAIYPHKCYLYTENPSSITKAINVEKEIYSSRVIIEDFSNNIDIFLKGEQKIAILYILNTALQNHYYKSEDEKKQLLNFFMDKCNLIEKVLLIIWNNLSTRKHVKTKVFHLLIRVFKF